MHTDMAGNVSYEGGSEMRRRTVQAVTETELCYISRESVTEICVDYPELRARLHRFSNAAKPMNAKRLKKAGLTRMDLQTFSTDCEYTRHVSARWPCAFFAACFPAAALLVC